MVSLTCDAERVDGVTLVTATVTGDDVARRVRLANRLDGPVWPPRSEGVPEAGWDEAGLTCTIDPGERRAVGYATPADPADPPVELTEASVLDGPVGGAEPTDGDTPDAASVRRELGDHAPPRDAVPTPGARPAGPERAGPAPSEGDASGPVEPAGGSGPDVAEGPPPGCPDAVATWLDAMAERADTAAALGPNADVGTATGAMDGLDGAGAARDLAATLEGDAVAAAWVADRAATLAERAREREVATEAIEGLS